MVTVVIAGVGAVEVELVVVSLERVDVELVVIAVVACVVLVVEGM